MISFLFKIMDTKSMMIGMLMAVSYLLGLMSISDRQYHECDCDTIIPLKMVKHINDELLKDNIRLKHELYIALDYINYTNIGTTHFDRESICAMEDNTLSFAYNKFIIDFYEMKTKLYRSVMDLIESKQLLYKQYIELSNRCIITY